MVIVGDLTFLAADIAVAHVRSELSGDARAPGQTFPYRKTILFTKQQGIWRIRATAQHAASGPGGVTSVSRFRPTVW